MPVPVGRRLVHRPIDLLSCLEPPAPQRQTLEHLPPRLDPEDLKPIEQAKAFCAIMELNGWSTHDVARELAADQSSVVRALHLLQLPAAVLEQVEQGALTPATAYELSKLDEPAQQVALASRLVAEKLTRAQTTTAVTRSAVRSHRTGRRPVRKLTSRVFRKMTRGTITVENRSGLDAATIRAALAAVLDCLNVEATSDATAA